MLLLAAFKEYEDIAIRVTVDVTEHARATSATCLTGRGSLQRDSRQEANDTVDERLPR